MRILERSLIDGRRASAGCLVLGALALASGCRRGGGETPVRLVLVSIDTLRADAVLGEGPRRARTPTLDALARAGLALENAHAHVPLTLPSHANLLTGRLPPALGLHDNTPFPLRGDVPTLAAWLVERGFATDAVIGGQPLALGSGIERGFERFDDPPHGEAGTARFGERGAAEVTDRALAAWSRPTGGRRRFLFVHYFDPHQPYDPPADCVAGDRSDPEARYFGEVAYVDRELARLVEALRAGGERCLLVVTSDHGEGLGDHGERTHGYQVFESTLRVPMVLVEIEGGRTAPPRGLAAVDRARLVRMVDLLPTLLRELRVEAPAGLDGVALQDRPSPGAVCYVESLAGSLQLGWAQVTGVRGERATLVRAGAGTPAAIEGLGGVLPGPEDERLLLDSGASPPAESVLSAWRAALATAREAAPAAPLVRPSLPALAALGYPGGSGDRARHELLPPGENAALPSPLGRRAEIEALLLAVERLEGGDPAGAEGELTRLLDPDPDLRAARFHRARARLRLETGDGRRAREAAADLAALLALESGWPGAELLRIKALGLAGEFDAALATLARLAGGEESAAVERLLGSLLLQRESAGRANPRYDPEAGYSHLLRSLELDPRQHGLAEESEQHLRRLAAAAGAPSWAKAALERLARIRRGRGGRYRRRDTRYPLPIRARVRRRTNAGEERRAASFDPCQVRARERVTHGCFALTPFRDAPNLPRLSREPTGSRARGLGVPGRLPSASGARARLRSREPPRRTGSVAAVIRIDAPSHVGRRRAMVSPACTTLRLLSSTSLAVALAACAGSDPGPSGPAAGTAAAAAAPSAAPAQERDSASLAQQKKDLLVSTAIETAKAQREAGDLVSARLALEEALAIDPGNAVALAQYSEVLELLGERPGDIQTTKRVAELQRTVRLEALRREADEFHRVGQEARTRRDFDAAIRWFERVDQSIRWSSLEVDWGDLAKRNADALAAARREREAALTSDREAKLKEAVERIKDDERAERMRAADRLANLLESANFKFDAGDYVGAIELCDQVLILEPGNLVARDLRRAADDGRRQARSAEFRKTRGEMFRRFKSEIEELRIPYSDGLTAPDPEYWARVTRRTATGAGGESAASAEDARIKEMLKSIRIPHVNFEDDELKTVCTVLSNFSGVTILATPAVQSELESSGTLVTLTNLTNLPLDSILTIVTRRLGDKYAWTVKNGVVQVTTIEDAFGATVIRTHAIQDLIFGRTDFKGPEINKIALPGEYGDDPETSVFAADLEKVVQITPEDIVTLIKENVARETWELGDKKFSIESAASNQILVIHTPEVHDEIEAFLNDLRRFTTTVVQIESRFVEVTDAFIQEIGTDFRGLGGVFGSNVTLDDTTSGPEDNASRGLDNLGTGLTGAAAPSAGIFFNDNSDGDIRGRTENYFENPLGSLLSTSGGGSFQFGILDDTQFNAVITAVEKSVNATEVMAPELTVFNTERAYVTVINEVSFLQDFDVDVANTAFIANPEVGILQEGVVLDVRPTVSYDRKYVTLEVRATVATIQRPIQNFETTLGGFSDAVTFQLPRLEVQNANTTVIVPDGGSVILGGLKTLNYVNRRAEVPWIARIPIVGFFFRQKGVADEARSLVILVKADIRDLSRFREATPIR